MFPGARHLNLMEKKRSHIISDEFKSLIPKFQGLGCNNLKFGGLRLTGLEFESLVLDPSVSDLRPGLGGSRPEMFLGFDLG
jgi:hypothetical protein